MRSVSFVEIARQLVGMEIDLRPQYIYILVASFSLTGCLQGGLKSRCDVPGEMTVFSENGRDAWRASGNDPRFVLLDFQESFLDSIFSRDFATNHAKEVLQMNEPIEVDCERHKLGVTKIYRDTLGYEVLEFPSICAAKNYAYRSNHANDVEKLTAPFDRKKCLTSVILWIIGRSGDSVLARSNSKLCLSVADL